MRRRRLLIAAFLLDGLCAIAAPFVLPAAAAEAPDRYVQVAGECVEVLPEAGEVGVDTVGRPVDSVFCE